MEKLSRVMGLRVLAIKEGLECGDISEFVVDAEAKAIKFVVIDTGKGCFGLEVLPIEAVSGMGIDYATTATVETLSNVWETPEAMTLSFTDVDIIGARVVSSTGDVLGKIQDFEFDPESGEISAYIMEDGTTIDKQCIYTLSRGIVFVDKSVMDETGVSVEPQAASEPVAVEPTPMLEATAEPAAEEAAPQPEAPAVEPQLAGEEEGTRSYFDQRRSEFLMGKTLKQDILDDEGNVLVAKDTVIDEAVMETIKSADKMVELTMSVN